MGRFVLYAGIVVMVVGIIGFVFGVIEVPLQIVNTVTSASHPDATKLCNPGETLATEVGPEEYDDVQHLYVNPTDFYCVNGQGTRRDVTDQIGQGVVNSIFGSFGSVLIPIVSSLLCVVGVFMIVFGAIFSRRKTFRATTMITQGRGYWTDPTTNRLSSPQEPSEPQPPIDSDLAGRLRQLEEARQSGLLTEDEYQRKRQQILGSMN